MTRREKQSKIDRLLEDIDYNRKEIDRHRKLISAREFYLRIAVNDLEAAKRRLYQLGWKG